MEVKIQFTSCRRWKSKQSRRKNKSRPQFFNKATIRLKHLVTNQNYQVSKMLKQNNLIKSRLHWQNRAKYTVEPIIIIMCKEIKIIMGTRPIKRILSIKEQLSKNSWFYLTMKEMRRIDRLGSQAWIVKNKIYKMEKYILCMDKPLHASPRLTIIQSLPTMQDKIHPILRVRRGLKAYETSKLIQLPKEMEDSRLKSKVSLEERMQ
jgi:hypothetical protein